MNIGFIPFSPKYLPSSLSQAPARKDKKRGSIQTFQASATYLLPLPYIACRLHYHAIVLQILSKYSKYQIVQTPFLLQYPNFFPFCTNLPKITLNTPTTHQNIPSRPNILTTCYLATSPQSPSLPRKLSHRFFPDTIAQLYLTSTNPPLLPFYLLTLILTTQIIEITLTDLLHDYSIKPPTNPYTCHNELRYVPLTFSTLCLFFPKFHDISFMTNGLFIVLADSLSLWSTYMARLKTTVCKVSNSISLPTPSDHSLNETTFSASGACRKRLINTMDALVLNSTAHNSAPASDNDLLMNNNEGPIAVCDWPDGCIPPPTSGAAPSTNSSQSRRR
jgi:hypothetical protein